MISYIVSFLLFLLIVILAIVLDLRITDLENDNEDLIKRIDKLETTKC